MNDYKIVHCGPFQTQTGTLCLRRASLYSIKLMGLCSKNPIIFTDNWAKLNTHETYENIRSTKVLPTNYIPRNLTTLLRLSKIDSRTKKV